jgi:HTH-type transcriptional regulator/antitoxin HigA
MEEHSLKQSDLSKELGSQSVVSEILSGKRRLNSQQVLALSKRFGVSPSAFFP